MNRPPRVALVGNSFASKVQLPCLRWVGENEVVSIAGADADKAARIADRWEIPHATGDWRTSLEQDPDLVIIATPVHLHGEIVRATLETSAAILCEKPFTLDAAEAAALTDGARGRLALIDHQLRWSPWRRRMKSLVDEGFLGAPWSGRVQMLFGAPGRIDAPWGWWYDAERGGGMLGAIGSHMLDGLLHDLGPVEAVCARLLTYRPERTDTEGRAHAVTADEHATLWLRLANGAQVELDTNIMAPGSTGSLVEYVGSEGTLRLDDEEHLVGARHGDTVAPIDVPDDVPTAEELGTEGYGGMFPRVLPLYLRDVLQAVRDGATELPGAATFADGLATMRVMDAARRSARDGGWVDCRA